MSRYDLTEFEWRVIAPHLPHKPRGVQVMLAITPGQTHDKQMAAELLGDLGEGTMVLADKAYDADWLRALVDQQGGWAAFNNHGQQSVNTGSSKRFTLSRKAPDRRPSTTAINQTCLLMKNL